MSELAEDALKGVVEGKQESTMPTLQMAKSAATFAFLAVLVYAAGYFDFSILFVITPVVLFVLRSKRVEQKRNKVFELLDIPHTSALKVSR